ncbi:poly-beta-1,6-N-acetyl-D-glucosamine biosynthesis protein PgaD [Pectobacterium cacticida]|uniref:poly-beta-1,6-N-acetyl-D-glucosamine biosynthesis protein PgaD n=1 Tax=Pectobacterium cacticida TaxID=69221 RepID=UPI002FEFF799
MHSPLIITERHWFPLLIDAFLTLCGWGIFIWLFSEVFISAFGDNIVSDRSFFTLEKGTVSIPLCIFLVNALILIAWGKLEQYRYRIRKEQRMRSGALDIEHIASSFSLSDGFVQELNRNKIQRIWHNEHGNIIGVDNLSS